jgi:penicillin-binding protein 1A
MEPNLFEKWVKILISTVMIFITVIIVFGILSYFYFTYDLPSIETLKNYKPSTITRFFSEEGEVIGEFFSEKREVVSLDRVPNHLVQAFVAGEDARFFQHKGLDYLAILRALFRNIFSGEIVQGGSTITQQVIKSLLLSPERSFKRKIREAILAYRIEKYLSKEEILFLYLNQIYLGHGAYGVAAAAEQYFEKPVEELNLAESTLLAGLPQAPSKYSPYHHPEQAKKRQIYILNRMVEEGFISNSDLMKALQSPIKIRSKQNSFTEKAPHFIEYVRRYIEEKYGREALYKNGLQVYTTIDLAMQRIAQEAVKTGLEEIEKREKYSSTNMSLTLEGSLICFDLKGF